MPSGIRVATPPPKPLLVFDGDCNFCAFWVRRWQRMTGDGVDYVPAQDPAVRSRFPEIPPDHFAAAVQLIEPGGAVYGGAEAVFRALAGRPDRQWPLRWYEHSRIFAGGSEWAYRLVAGHRTFFSRLTRWFWGRDPEPPEYILTRRIFLGALGLIYLIAFVSLWIQIDGLIGSDGILPADRFMGAVATHSDARGIGLDRFYIWPTLCWLGASNPFLQCQCAAGAILASLLVFDIAPLGCLVLLWLLYLSLTVVGQDFLGFQWDNLLLETGFLSVFLASWHGWPRRGASARSPSRIGLWLLRLLLFKLMFSSGCVKLSSGDPAWRHLSALAYHYQTQPLPTWIAWYAHQLPLGFQKFSCSVVFAAELGAPFLIFGPRRLRLFGAAILACLQVLILLTGNYTFFNGLTLALCLLLWDDRGCMKLLPFKSRRGSAAKSAEPGHTVWPKAVLVPFAVIVVALDLVQIDLAMGGRPGWLWPAAVADAWLAPLRTFNGYGLFAVMTTGRHEIIVEGSNDGVHWRPYEFKYKPGDVNRRPAFVAPHQPRLDWQMWFAALGDYRQNPWFVNFCERLLQGSPDVLALLAKNPFPGQPPRLVRAELYDYRFTTVAERRATGAWWHRRLIGEYLPPIALNP